MAGRPRTISELVLHLAGHPAKGLAVLDRRGKTTLSRPYPEVATRARAWAAWFEGQGVQPGDLVYLCLQTSHDLVEAFLGASLAGALPCCLALPRAIGGLDVFRRRLGLLERFGRNHLVATPDVGAEAGRPFLAPPELDLSRLAPLPAQDESAIAYVQLTSGSTQTPKCVAITHRNLADNTLGIIRGGDGRSYEDFVSWLPLYHDMGLVGMVFTALFNGPGLVLMAPETFVGTPIRWLEAIGERPCTVVTTAPNFGYQWCVDRIAPEKVSRLKLGNWRLACCGAEMVRPATIDEFAAKFGPAGFRKDSFGPCYGMAEATLAVTMCLPPRDPVVVDGNVSCGAPIPGMTVEVHPSGEPLGAASLPDGVEGEIVLRGPSIFAGYFKDPEATAAVLMPDGRFRSGDLGYLRAGELHVTGRVKDLLIIDGVNVAPHELEWLAQAHVDLDGGRAAAFSIERERREVPVLVVEVKEVPPAAQIDALRASAARDVTPLFDLVLVRRGGLPKTSSGKVQRSAVKSQYLAATLEGVLWRLRAEPAPTPAPTEAS